MATVEATPHKSKSMTAPHSAKPITAHQPWYKDAIIYQIHVRAFRDSNRLEGGQRLWAGDVQVSIRCGWILHSRHRERRNIGD